MLATLFSKGREIVLRIVLFLRNRSRVGVVAKGAKESRMVKYIGISRRLFVMALTDKPDSWRTGCLFDGAHCNTYDVFVRSIAPYRRCSFYSTTWRQVNSAGLARDWQCWSLLWFPFPFPLGSFLSSSSKLNALPLFSHVDRSLLPCSFFHQSSSSILLHHRFTHSAGIHSEGNETCAK
jgi:hypothetical protein